MEVPFIYDNYVTGKDFVGRKSECTALLNLLSANENVVIAEPPKTGKKSLVNHVLFNMRLNSVQFNASFVKMFNVRTVEEFFIRLGGSIIRSVASSPGEYLDIISRHLEGTHFIFDAQRFADCDSVVSLNWDIDRSDMEAMFSLPEKLAQETGGKIIVVLDEFQNILLMEEWETVLHAMENVLLNWATAPKRPECCYIMSGSKVNAMKYIFKHGKYFYKLAEHLPIGRIDERELTEHIRKGFLRGGKEIENDHAVGACRLFKGNIWYINHFASICDSLSKGYMNEGIMMESLNTLLSIHEPRFQSMADSLTDHQTSFLRAVIDGETRFSSSDVIEQYSLNSSANVKRVKDALMKKEILTFNDQDEPIVLDPLFEYWVTRFYFGIFKK